MPQNWICPKCKAYNHTRRQTCWQCGCSLAEDTNRKDWHLAIGTFRGKFILVIGVISVILCAALLTNRLAFHANPLTATMVKVPIPTLEAAVTPSLPVISYNLNWKIEEGQPIAYSTVMEVSNSDISADLDRIFNFGQADESSGQQSFLEEMFENLKTTQTTYSIVSILEKNPRGNISIKMVLNNVDMLEQEPDDSMGQEFSQLLKGIKGSSLLQGEITPEGEIVSTCIAQRQRNLLALFFELPGKPINVGDTWQIDLNCIIMDSSQFTIENFDRVNQVTFTKIVETPEGEPVAILDYLIVESVEGEQTIPFFSSEPISASMKCSFIGRGQFLIEQGRWKQFSAEHTIQTTGVITSDVTQHLALSPLEQVPEYSGTDTP